MVNLFLVVHSTQEVAAQQIQKRRLVEPESDLDIEKMSTKEEGFQDTLNHSRAQAQLSLARGHMKRI